MVVEMDWVEMMGREAMRDGFKYVCKMGAQGILGTLTRLLGRLARDGTEATSKHN